MFKESDKSIKFLLPRFHEFKCREGKNFNREDAR